MDKSESKIKLKKLIERYNSSIRNQSRKDISEETIRTWLNEFLDIFGWNVQDPSQVLQERILDDNSKKKLKAIDSTHTCPDYILKNGLNIKTFLDAKSLDINIFEDKDAAFQIRSYGWSAGVPCAFISNFEQFSIYETENVPCKTDDVKKYVLYQLNIDNYLDNFDIIYDYLDHDLICSNHLESLCQSSSLQGKTPLDVLFARILDKYRLIIAKDLFVKNRDILETNEQLNFYTQAILDRIIFIRVCEAKGIEKENLLKDFCKCTEGFWKKFKDSCYMNFYNHYDGTLFPRDNLFNQLKIDDNILVQFVQELYYPSPYKFDIIPIKVIAAIYEKFLGNQLVINGTTIKQELKTDYIKTNGVVLTPEYIVDMICKLTIKLDKISTIDDLLRIKILDPCCGSGVFLIACYELLAAKMIDLFKASNKMALQYNSLFVEKNQTVFLTIEGRRVLINNCLYGIDYDESAVEVTKMSLSLKMIDGTDALYWKEIGAFGKQILRDISHNIRLGNSLVSEEASFSPTDLLKTKPLKIEEKFDYIVCNPPYVETKYYKADNKQMHSYLKNKYKSFEKKADLAVLFLERSLDLLNNNGRAGFIIQKRWFKTEYGRGIRNIISNNGHLDTMIDLEANDLFASRQTYVAICILSNKKDNDFKYQFINGNKEKVKKIFENSDNNGFFDGSKYIITPMPTADSTWAFENYDVSQLVLKLAEKYGRLKDFPGLQIKDGIQALWKKVFHVKDVIFDGAIATGKNGFGQEIRLEKDILRQVVYNSVFYPFKEISPNTYCIFPYYGESTDVIPIKVIKTKYPLLYSYLKENEQIIKENVNCRSGDTWYRFTREHNHSQYSIPKIIIPMTAPDTIATYIADKGLYMDNSNVWFITINNSPEDIMKAITCIINSTAFSVLAKAGANPQLNNYYKFNKQFLSPVPFPNKNLFLEKNIELLINLYNSISQLQILYIKATAVLKENIANHLNEKWQELDSICNNLYGLTESEISLINKIGRSVSRISLLNGLN